MLIPSSSAPAESELLAHVRGWINLLAGGEFALASRELDGANSYGTLWTPAAISHAIARAYPPGCRFRAEHPEGPIVSRVDAVSGDGRPSVIEFADGSGYSVEHALPLNGEYADLTVQVEFRWRGTQLAMLLHDIHIL